MTGILIGIWSTPTMTADHLVFALGASIYICVGVHFEERTLRRELGGAYQEYCARVRSVVPTFAAARPFKAR